MRPNCVLRCTAMIISLLWSISVSAQSPSVTPAINFKVSMSQPHTHLLEVEIRIRQPKPATDLVMPVWTPGSYLIREFERHVQDFAATGPDGQPLAWTKTNKNTWRIVTRGAADWRATYRVYANEFSVRTNELNADHASWNNAGLLMYPDGLLNATSTLQIVPPESWRVATALPPVPHTPNTFHAENFDVLYDSPVEVGTFKTISFEVKGIPHRLVIDGEGNYNADKVLNDVKTIVETQVEIMGGEIPYRDYTFFVHLRTNSTNGLEHANSSSLSYPRLGFAPDLPEGSPPRSPPQRTHRDFLSLVSHEFFHVWNAKRIRPDVLGPFDYTRENYTKLLWVAEGITSYYGRLAMQRAGFTSEQSFLRDTAAAFQSLQRTPGRLVQSVEESSFDAWIKYYRQDENSINSQVSYYDKGAILGLLLDLEIRKSSGGAKSLDEVMRHLNDQFYEKGRNYSPEDFQKVCELMAGSSLEQFFSRYVRGREELDYDSALSAAGLQLDKGIEQVTSKAYLGADLGLEPDRLVVTRVYASSPAYEQGLNTGDQILTINNLRATRELWNSLVAGGRPGDVITLTIFRLENLRTLTLKLGEAKEGSYRILALPNPTALQKRVYESWLRVSSAK